MTGDRLDDLIATLARLREMGGAAAHRRAVAAARAAVARVVLGLAERRAGVGARRAGRRRGRHP